MGGDINISTRSLHAEENAFLQITKYGGQKIQGGFLFTTASPCELCAKKAYQLGISKIFYIDPYPGIATDHILASGTKNPLLYLFRGAVGVAFHKLYQPIMPYKDELPLMDVPYNNEIWVRNVQSTVNGLVTAHYTTPHRAAKIALIGHKKDQTGFYLNLFPQWHSISIENHRAISATPVREGYFIGNSQQVIASMVDTEVLPKSVANYLLSFAKANDGYAQVRDEILFIKKYQEAWKAAPYAPTFVTVDSIVIQSGHVLLIERKANPGKGLWALPGGFLDQGERVLDACLRELREETKLKIPTPVLKGSIKRQAVYDDPHRSARGRTVTHAFYIELEPNAELPKVKGGDDAKHARWVPLSELDPQLMFEDHYFIIQDMLGAV